MSDLTVPEILECAADHLEQYGWRKGALGKPGEPCCVAGALQAVTNHPNDQRYNDALINLEIHVGSCAIGVWNDVFIRTREEVLYALRDCAAKLRCS